MPDDLVPRPYDVRASDPERERVAEAVRAHAAAGRIDPDELEERLGRAYAARTRADLVPLTADLPALPAPTASATRRLPSVPAVPPVVLVAVLLVAIWALTGAGYFWPIWPIGGMALHAFKHGRHRVIGRHTLIRS
jgi:hypothetical protein